jgi:hypothetical protein
VEFDVGEGVESCRQGGNERFERHACTKVRSGLLGWHGAQVGRVHYESHSKESYQ